MSRVTQHQDGVTCWMDLAASDVAAAVDFYGDLFGWSAEVGLPETGGYRRCQLDGLDVAGIGPKMDDNQPDAWTPYIRTSDIVATVNRAEQLGATPVFGPHQVLEFGSLALFTDPVGATLGLWQPITMQGTLVIDEPGAWTWTELMTSDLDASTRFYSELFNWTVSESTAASGEYREMKINDTSVGGMMPRPDTVPEEVPNYWGLYFATESLDKSVEIVTMKGGHIVFGPMEIEPGRFAGFVDPQGAMFSLLEPSH